MNRPLHAIARTERWSSSRIAGLAVAGLINIGFVWALTSGMAIKIVKAIPQSLEVSVLPSEDEAKPAPNPPKPAEIVPDSPAAVAPPEIEIQSDSPPPVTARANPSPSAPVVDGAASAVGGTHTIPPYPPEARRLGQQGVVTLHLTISPTGEVTAADVVQSSGFPELDNTAAAWVRAHWKYKPAVEGGVAVMSTTTAAVKFDLKKA